MIESHQVVLYLQTNTFARLKGVMCLDLNLNMKFEFCS